MNMNHLLYIAGVAQEDCKEIRRKEETYKGSWKKRGGIGAFMMAARKWDRLEGMAEENSYEIFEMLYSDGADGADGTPLAEIRDLRRYLLLIEAEYLARRAMGNGPGTPEDGGHHEQT